jgi:hypothetical protein
VKQVEWGQDTAQEAFADSVWLCLCFAELAAAEATAKDAAAVPPFGLFAYAVAIVHCVADLQMSRSLLLHSLRLRQQHVVAEQLLQIILSVCVLSYGIGIANGTEEHIKARSHWLWRQRTCLRMVLLLLGRTFG